MGIEYNHLVAKDINGIERAIPLANLQNIVLFGMSMNTIMALREHYLEQGGKMEITVDSIRELWG